MKKTLLLIASLVIITGLICIGVVRYSLHKTNAGAPHAGVSTPNATHPVPPPLLASDEWPKYRSVRQAILQTDPALQGEYIAILQGMDAQQTQLDAAMLKTDPKLKPVIAKLVALRIQPSGAQPAIKLTSEDWQELRTAHGKAIQSNPDLTLESQKLADRMRAYEDKLDAAMLKADPSVAPLITKFEAGRQPQTALINSAVSK